MVQLLTIVMMFSNEAYQLAYSLCTPAITISWTLAAAYMVKLGIEQRKEGRTDHPKAVGNTEHPNSERVRGADLALASFTVVFLVVAVALAGIQQPLLCCIAYIPGIFFYKKAQREREMLQ